MLEVVGDLSVSNSFWIAIPPKKSKDGELKSRSARWPEEANHNIRLVYID